MKEDELLPDYNVTKYIYSSNEYIYVCLKSPNVCRSFCLSDLTRHVRQHVSITAEHTFITRVSAVLCV